MEKDTAKLRRCNAGSGHNTRIEGKSNTLYEVHPPCSHATLRVCLNHGPTYGFMCAPSAERRRKPSSARALRAGSKPSLEPGFRLRSGLPGANVTTDITTKVAAVSYSRTQSMPLPEEHVGTLGKSYCPWGRTPTTCMFRSQPVLPRMCHCFLSALPKKLIPDCTQGASESTCGANEKNEVLCLIFQTGRKNKTRNKRSQPDCSRQTSTRTGVPGGKETKTAEPPPGPSGPTTRGGYTALSPTSVVAGKTGGHGLHRAEYSTAWPSWRSIRQIFTSLVLLALHSPLRWRRHCTRQSPDGEKKK